MSRLFQVSRLLFFRKFPTESFIPGESIIRDVRVGGLQHKEARISMRQQISLNAYQKDQSIGTIICKKSELQGRYRLNKKCQIFTRQSNPSSPQASRTVQGEGTQKRRKTVN